MHVSEIESLRDATTARAASLADLTGVRVLSRKTGELASQIERDLGLIGIVVIVMIPQAQPRNRQSQRPVLDPVKVRFRVVEDKLLNKSGRSALYVAERLLAHFLWWKPPVETVPGGDRFESVDPGLLELNLIGKPGEDANEDYVGWDVFFETKLALLPAQAPTQPVSRTADSTDITADAATLTADAA